MKARAFVKYFVYGSHCKDFFASNSLQAPLNLIRLKNFGNSKAFNTVFTQNLGELSRKKVLKLVLLV